MNTALIILGVLATTCALTDGSTMKTTQDGSTTLPPLNYSIMPRIPARIPQFNLPAFGSILWPLTTAPRKIIKCSRQMTTVTLAPGESATFQSPNYPSKYGPKSKCRWQFKSTKDISISCNDFTLESQSKKGKCRDKLKIGSKKYCGSSSPNYEGGTKVTVLFTSNKKNSYSGFSCTATAGKSSSCKCGQANRAKRIVGGVETEENEYPWQAALVYYGSNSVFCGASVIGSKHILTAAHCTQAITTHSIRYQVIVGAHSRTSPAPSHLNLDAARIIQHPGYSSSSLDNDISIIELSKAISFTNTEVRPVCLPKSDANSYDRILATVSGWGTTEYQGSLSNVLMEVDVPTMTNTKCLSYYSRGITDNMICAGYHNGGHDSCQGDSGGPLTYNPRSGYTQIGVVSWGYKCAEPRFPGVYARVSKYLSWISRNTASSTTCPAA